MAAAVEQERLAGVEASVVERERAGRAPVAEEKTFRRYDPGQVLLMAPVLQEWVPDGDLAHLVSDLVEVGTLDLSGIYASYEDERGYPPYDPRLMVKLVVYGYANGVMSSRKLERATYRDVAVGLPPVWRTLLWLLYSVCISYESEQSLSSRRSGVCVSGG